MDIDAKTTYCYSNTHVAIVEYRYLLSTSGNVGNEGDYF